MGKRERAHHKKRHAHECWMPRQLSALLQLQADQDVNLGVVMHSSVYDF